MLKLCTEVLNKNIKEGKAESVLEQRPYYIEVVFYQFLSYISHKVVLKIGVRHDPKFVFQEASEIIRCVGHYCKLCEKSIKTPYIGRFSFVLSFILSIDLVKFT